MLDQFSRTELLLGNENMIRLKNARVAIFGIGGVGGYTTEAWPGAVWERWTSLMMTGFV